LLLLDREIAEPGGDANEQRDLNTHYLLTAWKELLEARKKNRGKEQGQPEIGE
jgi:hypothetical protein